MKISNHDYLLLAICLVLVCFGLFEIVMARGPMKGGRAIGLDRVDVDLLLEQNANGLSIRPHDRVRQPEIGTGGAQTDSQNNAQPESAETPLVHGGQSSPDRLDSGGPASEKTWHLEAGIM